MSEMFYVMGVELRRIFAVRSAFSAMILAVLIYAVLYPQPYLAETLRDVPIAVVDQDRSTASQDLLRRIDATEMVEIAQSAPDMVAAQRLLFERQVYGILVIPQDFERSLLRGSPAPVALYGDASYFLMYQRIAGGVSAVTRTVGAEVEAGRLIASGIDPTLAAAAGDPMPVVAVPLFNPQGGYATYLLPAAFVLILQQTLMMAVGLLGTAGSAGMTAETSRRVRTAGALGTVIGKTLAYLVIQSVLFTFCTIVLPALYGIPRLGSPLDILAVGLPFVLAVSLLGQACAVILKRGEIVQLVLIAVGLPFFFLSGFSWPTSAMPQAIVWIAQLVPSTSAIEALVRVGQMGAPLSAVKTETLTLWALVVLYGSLAVLFEYRRGGRLLAAAEPVAASNP